MTPAAMTEEQLTEAIESTLAAAHIACQGEIFIHSFRICHPKKGFRGGRPRHQRRPSWRYPSRRDPGRHD
jgi:hypothetical protein